MGGLGGQEVAAARMDLHPALAAGSAAAAGRGHEDTGVGQRVEQFQADRYRQVLLPVQIDVDGAGGDQPGARQQDDADEHQHDGGEQRDS